MKHDSRSETTRGWGCECKDFNLGSGLTVAVDAALTAAIIPFMWRRVYNGAHIGRCVLVRCEEASFGEIKIENARSVAFK